LTFAGIFESMKFLLSLCILFSVPGGYLMLALGNIPNSYYFSQMPSRLISHSTSSRQTQDTFQSSNKSFDRITFKGAHSSVVDGDGKNLGEEAANNDQWAPKDTSDAKLQGKIESDVLLNGTTYFFTKYHKGLYQLEEQRKSSVKRQDIEWIAGLPSSTAKAEYEKRLASVL
jgi:hypothetical protein